MRILCVCNGGNCRSVALAEVLKGIHGLAAISAGTFWVRGDDMLLLAEWADRIFMVEGLDADLPPEDLARWKASPVWKERFNAKRFIIPIGPDVWGHAKWDEIKRRCAFLVDPFVGR